MGTVVNFKDALGSVAMFTTVVLPIHEYGLFSHLMSSSMFESFYCRSFSPTCFSDLGYLSLFVRILWMGLFSQFISCHTHWCVKKVSYSTAPWAFCLSLQGRFSIEGPLASFLSHMYPSLLHSYLAMNDDGGLCQWLILHLLRDLEIPPVLFLCCFIFVGIYMFKHLCIPQMKPTWPLLMIFSLCCWILFCMYFIENCCINVPQGYWFIIQFLL